MGLDLDSIEIQGNLVLLDKIFKATTEFKLRHVELCLN